MSAREELQRIRNPNHNTQTAVNWNDPNDVLSTYKMIKQINQLMMTAPKGPDGKPDPQVLDSIHGYDKFRIEMMKRGYKVD